MHIKKLHNNTNKPNCSNLFLQNILICNELSGCGRHVDMSGSCVGELLLVHNKDTVHDFYVTLG